MPDQSIIAIKAVTINEQFFQGHFPGRPIMPGVLIVEALAQAAGVLAVEVARPRRAPASWSISWRSTARSSARRSSPACCSGSRSSSSRSAHASASSPAGRRVDGKLAAEAQFHGDDRRSARRPDAPATAVPLDPEGVGDSSSLASMSAGADRRRTLPSAISSARSNAPTRSMSWSATRALAAGVRPSPADLQQPQHPIGVEVRQRLVEQQQSRARGASARANSTRVRSPVDSRSTGRSANGSSSSRSISSSTRCGIGAGQTQRDHVARADRPDEVARRRQKVKRSGRRPAASDSRSLAVDREPRRRSPRSRRARGAGWSCRRRWGRPARPVRPAATSRSVGFSRPSSATAARFEQ